MVPPKRKAIGGYGFLSIFVAVIFVLSLVALTPEFTGFFAFRKAGVIEKTFPLNSNFTESGSPHVISIPQGEKMKSLKVTGTIYGRGKVKIVLVSGGKEWVVMEKDTTGTSKSGTPFTGMATGTPNQTTGDEENATVPETNDTAGKGTASNVTAPESNVTEENSAENTNATTPTENISIPKNATVTGNTTHPENETNAAVPPEENVTEPELNATIPEENTTEENVTEPPEESETNMTLPPENVTHPENATEPEENVTLSNETNITVPEEEINATEPEANVTVPEENVTLPEENASENITTPPAVKVLHFTDECEETCNLLSAKNTELLAVVEGDAVLHIDSLKYEVESLPVEGKITGKDKINRTLRQLDPYAESLTLRDISAVQTAYLKQTGNGYNITLELGQIPYTIELDSSMLKKLRPGVLRYMAYEPSTRVLVKTGRTAKFLSVDGWENSSLIEKIRPENISSDQFKAKYSRKVEKYHKKNVFLDVGNGTLLDVEQTADGYVSVTTDTAGLEALLRSNAIEEVLPDKQFLSSTTESINITRTNLVQTMGYNGSGKKICIIDSGVNASAAGLTDGVNVFGYDFIHDDSNYSDEYGHGTMVSYIASKFAAAATVYEAKVIGSDGVGYSSDIIAALDWCSQNNVDVVSISLSEGWYEGYCDFDIVAQKVNELSSNGIPVVAATGNNLKTDAVSNPACASSAIRVAASEKSDRFWMLSNYNNATLLVAPGMDINTVTNDGSSVTVSGTSMSTAIISGITALLLENRSLTPNETWDLLVHTGDVITYHDNRTGYDKQFSRVNAWNALSGNVTNNLTEGPVGNASYHSWLFYPSSEGALCTYGNQCGASEYCVWSGAGSNGLCRGQQCDYDSVNSPSNVSGYGCSPNGQTQSYTTYGTCYDSTPSATGGTTGCDPSGEFSMNCGTTCENTDPSSALCTTTSGDACMSSVGGNFVQNGTCASGATSNCDTSSPVASDDGTSNFYAACAVGYVCDSSVTGGDFSRNGYCAGTSCATVNIAADNTIGGECGTGLSDCTAASFTDGDEATSCSSSNEGTVCSSTPELGDPPTANGVCVDSTCDTSTVALNCGTDGCTSADISAANMFTSCSGHASESCEFGSIGTNGFNQEGTCVSDGSCDTSGEVVKDGSTYYADCTSHVGAECDTAAGSGGDYSPNGICLSDSCSTGCASSPSGQQFEITDTSDNVVATIDETGDMFVDGDVYESQGALSPPAGSFIIQNSTDDTVAYIDSSGNMYLQGTVTTQDVTGLAGYNLELRDASDALVMWFDDEGNLKLAGCLVKNYTG